MPCFSYKCIHRRCMGLSRHLLVAVIARGAATFVYRQKICSQGFLQVTRPQLWHIYLMLKVYTSRYSPCFHQVQVQSQWALSVFSVKSVISDSDAVWILRYHLKKLKDTDHPIRKKRGYACASTSAHMYSAVLSPMYSCRL